MVWVLGLLLPLSLGVLNTESFTSASGLRDMGLLALVNLVSLAISKVLLPPASEVGAARPAATRSTQILSWGPWLLIGLFTLRTVRGLVQAGVTDTFEADVATIHSAVCLAALVIGWEARGALLHGLSSFLVLGTASTATLLLLPFPSQGLLTGNSGLDLQALLPGACIGVWRLVRGGPGERSIALVAVGATGALSVTSPVVGVALVLATWTLMASFLPRPGGPSKVHRSLAWLGAGVLLLGLSFSLGGTQTNPVDQVASPSESPAEGLPADSETTSESSPSELDGVGVRTTIWGTIPGLVREFPLGVGTGQFQAIYPPFRDAREIEATSHQRRLEAIHEVEHPHNDLLFALSEQGLLGGLLFGIGALLTALGIVIDLLGRGHDRNEARLGLGFGLLALIAAGVFHAPLLAGPLAGPIFFLLLGARANLGRASFSRVGSRLLGFSPLVLTGLCLGWLLPSAGDLQQHERLLWGRMGVTPRNPVQAIFARPDSFQALAAAARILDALGEMPTTEDGRPVDPGIYWTKALEVRPHSLEALARLGMLRSETGELAAALELWSHARELDSGYPVVLRNLRRLGADLVLTGALEAGMGELAPQLLVEGAVDANGNPIDLGSELVALAEQQKEAAQLALQGTEDAPDLHIARALICAAHWTWGREHAALGGYPTALRSYRQARRETAREPVRTNRALDFEYGALLHLTGDEAKATTVWALLEGGPGGIESLMAAAPAWARDAFSTR